MQLDELIALLQLIRRDHGGSIPVYRHYDGEEYDMGHTGARFSDKKLDYDEIEHKWIEIPAEKRVILYGGG